MLYTDLQSAHLRYTRRVTNGLRKPAVFKMLQSWRLAALIAGALVKGDAGRRAIKEAEAMVEFWEDKATAQDARQRQVDIDERAPWDKHR